MPGCPSLWIWPATTRAKVREMEKVISFGCTHDRATGKISMIVNFGARKQAQPVIADSIEEAVIETIKLRYSRFGREIKITSCKPKRRGKEQRAVARIEGGQKFWADGSNDVVAMVNACMAAAEAIIAEAVTT